MINEKEFGIVEMLDGTEEGDSSCNRESLAQWTDLSPFHTLDHYTEERVLLRKNTKSSVLVTTKKYDLFISTTVAARGNCVLMLWGRHIGDHQSGADSLITRQNTL